MNCKNCNKQFNSYRMYQCSSCRNTMCPSCAEKDGYVCEKCGGDVSLLS